MQIYPPYSNNLIIWFLTRLNSLRQRVSSRHGLCSLGLTQLCWSFLSSGHSAWILSSILPRSALLRPLELRAHTTQSLARQCYPGYLTGSSTSTGRKPKPVILTPSLRRLNLSAAKTEIPDASLGPISTSASHRILLILLLTIPDSVYGFPFL